MEPLSFPLHSPSTSNEKFDQHSTQLPQFHIQQSKAHGQRARQTWAWARSAVPSGCASRWRGSSYGAGRWGPGCAWPAGTGGTRAPRWRRWLTSAPRATAAAAGRRRRGWRCARAETAPAGPHRPSRRPRGGAGGRRRRAAPALGPFESVDSALTGGGGDGNWEWIEVVAVDGGF
jgi:hypothetical protein